MSDVEPQGSLDRNVSKFSSLYSSHIYSLCLLRFPSCSLSLGFTTYFPHAPHAYSFRFPDLITPLILGEVYKSRGFLCNFIHSFLISACLGRNNVLSTLFFNIRKMYSLWMRDQMSHHYKRRHETVILYVLIYTKVTFKQPLRSKYFYPTFSPNSVVLLLTSTD
jgi:hypothetical protein